MYGLRVTREKINNELIKFKLIDNNSNKYYGYCNEELDSNLDMMLNLAFSKKTNRNLSLVDIDKSKGFLFWSNDTLYYLNKKLYIKLKELKGIQIINSIDSGLFEVDGSDKVSITYDSGLYYSLKIGGLSIMLVLLTTMAVIWII
ncbi:MAG: hypothetical protein ACRCTB_08740 [Vibrio sp.]